ncbi:unnamed protein product [Rhizophagus irregularis]|nr:unnamed protein product [Rhizophagus irregularis]
MIKALEPGYDPPSRRVLSSTLLEAELSRVNARVNNELEKESNFTIALDDQVKCLVKRANILTRYFKNSTLASTWLKEAIDAKNIADGGLKTYIETRWMTVHECTSSVYRLKDALLHVRILYI